MTFTAGSLFAGIGGICIGFHKAGCHVKWANELDEKACQTYNLNKESIGHDVDIVNCDVRKFHPADKDIDILTAGFPCQPYSLAGRMNGLKDPRAEPMFREVVRIAKECNVRAIFLENVAQLKTLKNGEAYERYTEMLKDAGYIHIFDKILNTKDYGGIAQNRNRLYAIAFKNELDCNIFRQKAAEKLSKIEIQYNFDRVIEPSKKADDKYYYSQKKMLRFEEDVKPVVTDIGTFYQYRRNYTRTNMNGLCPALTASMGAGGHNVPLIRDEYGIRKLTPKECLTFQGFPEEYSFPDFGDCHKYKQVGNSVSVPVIQRLAEILVDSLEKADRIENQSF